MPIKQLLNAAICVFLCASCNTTYHFADFIKPSDVYIPSNVYRVGLLNRAAVPGAEAPIYVDGIPIEYMRGAPKVVSDKTLIYLRKEIEDLNRYQVVKLDWAPKKHNKNEWVWPSYSLAQVDSICNIYDLDGFIAIEGVDLMVKTGGEVEVVTATAADGMPVRVPEFTQQQEVEYNVVWRFYKRGMAKPIDVLDETYSARSYQTSYTPQENEDFDADLAFDRVAAQAAHEYHNRISPYWEGDYRLYYKGPGALIPIAYELDMTGNWEKAAQEWLPLTSDDFLKVQYGAKFNMAVASEMLGRPKVAKDWLLKAQKVDDTKQVRKYLEQIERQILIYDVIDRQLGL